MKVSFIHPRVTNASVPPMGLLMLGSVLRQKGYSVSIFDPRHGSNDWLKDFEKSDPKLIGITILTPQIQRAADVLKQIRRRMPGIPVIIGGVHCTALPEISLRALEADFVAVGEGEGIMTALCRCVSGEIPLSEVPGIGYLEKGEFKLNAPPEPVKYLDELPFPDWDLVNPYDYIRAPGFIRGAVHKRPYPILTSRGCPYSCIFCSTHIVFGNKLRKRSVEHVMNEIESAVEKFDIDALWFMDDHFMKPRDWLFDFCDRLKRNFPHLKWGCQGHVNSADSDILQAMKNAGCEQIEFGVESGSRRVLKIMKKGIVPDRALEVFENARQIGVRTLANFIIGLPGEREEDLQATMRLAKRIRASFTVATFATPLPGSELYTIALRQGLINERQAFDEKWIIKEANEPSVVMTLNKQKLIRYRARFDNMFFLKNHINYIRNPQILKKVFQSILRRPKPVLKGALRAVKTGRLAHIPESIWENLNLD